MYLGLNGGKKFKYEEIFISRKDKSNFMTKKYHFYMFDS